MRAATRRAVPEAVEGIGYPMPVYKLHGNEQAGLVGDRLAGLPEGLGCKTVVCHNPVFRPVSESPTVREQLRK